MAWPASTGGPSTWPPGQRPWRTSWRPHPPTTAADVAVKVRRLLASALAGGDGREAALARTALEALERLGDPA